PVAGRDRELHVQQRAVDAYDRGDVQPDPVRDRVVGRRGWLDQPEWLHVGQLWHRPGVHDYRKQLLRDRGRDGGRQLGGSAVQLHVYQRAGDAHHRRLVLGARTLRDPIVSRAGWHDQPGWLDARELRR